MTKNTDKLLNFRFHWRSFVVFILLFGVEVVIALFVNDMIIRPYGGDYLVVIMMFYFFKSFVDAKVNYLLLFVLALAYAVEIGQCFNMVSLLGLEGNKLMRIVLGTSFSWGDMMAYTLGVATCFWLENLEQAKADLKVKE